MQMDRIEQMVGHAERALLQHTLPEQLLFFFLKVLTANILGTQLWQSTCSTCLQFLKLKAIDTHRERDRATPRFLRSIEADSMAACYWKDLKSYNYMKISLNIVLTNLYLSDFSRSGRMLTSQGVGCQIKGILKFEFQINHASFFSISMSYSILFKIYLKSKCKWHLVFLQPNLTTLFYPHFI